MPLVEPQAPNDPTGVPVASNSVVVQFEVRRVRTWPLVGAIAMASGGWQETPDQGLSLWLTDQGQDPLAPNKWKFDFGYEGVTADVPITMTIACFTPPE